MIEHIDPRESYYDVLPWYCSKHTSSEKRHCTSWVNATAHDMQVVVKTGASENVSRLLMQLSTILSPIRGNILVFSDLEADVDGAHVQNIFDIVSEQELLTWPEYDYYKAIQTDRDATMREIADGTRESSGGWALDKYKNLLMVRKLWRGQGAKRKKFYFFLDTDTVVYWDNLIYWLQQFNPMEDHYFGSPVNAWSREFAHGGSGYVLSYGAMERLNREEYNEQEDLPARWSQFGVDTKSFLFEDAALAYALNEKDIFLKGHWPMFTGGRRSFGFPPFWEILLV